MRERKRMYIGTDYGLTLMINEGEGWKYFDDVLRGKIRQGDGHRPRQ